jgi:tRNA pseudouridine55 synthase
MYPPAISSNDLVHGVVDGLLCVYKNGGETPLQALQRLKSAYLVLNSVPLSYAGRLDPLADGVLLVLSGKYNTERQKYLGLDKKYKVSVLLGVATDTGDVLGEIKEDVGKGECCGLCHSYIETEDKIKSVLSTFVGNVEFPYPAYSSKTIDGVPMHVLARKGTLLASHIPKNNFTIHAIDFIGTEKNIHRSFEANCSGKD